MLDYNNTSIVEKGRGGDAGGMFEGSNQLKCKYGLPVQVQQLFVVCSLMVIIL